jgi:hypothetical protein
VQRRRKRTTNKQQTTNNKQQTTNNKQQTTNNKQQTTEKDDDRMGRIDRMKTLAREAPVIEQSWCCSWFSILSILPILSSSFSVVCCCCLLLLLLLPSSCRRLGVSG